MQPAAKLCLRHKWWRVWRKGFKHARQLFVRPERVEGLVRTKRCFDTLSTNDYFAMTVFAQLQGLKQTLAQQAIAKAEAAKIAAAKKAAADKAARLFTDTVGEVQALKPRNTVALPTSKPVPIAAQRQKDEQKVMQDSLSDEFGIEQLLETDQDLSYRAQGIGTDVLLKLRRGDWAIQGQLDLHGLRVEEARESLTAFINQAADRGWRCVRVVHGKGLGSKDKQPVLKGRVRSWLVQKQAVIAFAAARPAEGGAGALVVLLVAS